LASTAFDAAEEIRVSGIGLGLRTAAGLLFAAAS
jgi:hypothetical protein